MTEKLARFGKWKGGLTPGHEESLGHVTKVL